MSDDKEKIKALLGGDDEKGRAKRKTWALGAACIAVVAAFSWWMGSKDGGPRYLTEAVTRGELQVEVTANGTLEASGRPRQA